MKCLCKNTALQGGAKMLILWIILGIVLLLAILYIAFFNGLVGGRNQVKNAYSQIDVQLRRRHDLIPNLVNTVKGYAAHEKETLANVTNARTKAISADNASAAERGQAENVLTEALGKLFAVAEQYPDLKANTNFLALQEELSSTENKISFARQFYNDSVLRYNNRIEMFPTNIVASRGNFKKEQFFEVDNQTERAVPQVSF